jgi:AraC-like DNA-binding protein
MPTEPAPDESAVATVVVPARPFSPWLRLAHVWRYDGRHTREQLRVLADFEFLLQVEGTSWLVLPGRGRVAQPPGSLTLLPPGLVHAQAASRGVHVAVHADLHAQPRLVHPHMISRADGQADHDLPFIAVPTIAWRCGERRWTTPLVLPVAEVAAWRRRVAPLLAQWALRTHERPAERLVAGGILAALFHAVWTAGVTANGDDDVARVLADVDVRDRRLRVDALAHRAGLGQTAFRVAVRRLTGMTPAAWLESRRMQLARMLLAKGGLAVAEVAAACGYDDPFHFSRVCRRLTGRSPRAWSASE